jgi:3-oxoadipate enol-lactonase
MAAPVTPTMPAKRLSETVVPATRRGRLTLGDGASLAYEEAGSGPALILAHGLGGNHVSWWQQVPAFAGRNRVVTFSHRGFAPSTSPTPVPDPGRYAADLAALMDHLAIDRAVIVGQSMGGWTAVEAALAFPERVAGLVLACSTGTFDFDRFGDTQIQAWRAATPALVADLEHRNIHRAAGARMATEAPALLQLYEGIDRLNGDLDKEGIGRAIQAMRVRGADDAARITQPVLCIAGEEDVVISARGIALVAVTLPDARLVTIPASGHSVYFERANLFNAIVERFLDEIGWRQGHR